MERSAPSELSTQPSVKSASSFEDVPLGRVFSRLRSLRHPPSEPATEEDGLSTIYDASSSLSHEPSSHAGTSLGTDSGAASSHLQLTPEELQELCKDAEGVENPAWHYGTVTDDGGVELVFDDDDDKTMKRLWLMQELAVAEQDQEEDAFPESLSSIGTIETCSSGSQLTHLPMAFSFAEGHFKKLTLVLMVVGTRGDLQPFVGIGMKLKEYGHRVRLASHATYRPYVEAAGLEFYPLGGDPKVLSEFVVKHRGINPGFNFDELAEQRKQSREIMFSTWPACVEPDPEHPDVPFKAEGIVANPPCFGHIHCAQKLNIPLHMVFTMPWTPTTSYPQPFTRIPQSRRKGLSLKGTINWYSYYAMEDLMFLGIRDHVIDFRHSLGLKFGNDKCSNSHALYNCKIPFTYIWSPSLVPRPADWKGHVRVVGFVNVDTTNFGGVAFEAPKELEDFMAAGPPPIFISFGSLVMEKPARLTQRILRAVEQTGVRCIIQRGWGGLGSDLTETPPNVLLIGACPHDWLFPRCSAVVHHGGAGTTATGLMAGKPTFIIPFFGDQPFWGQACYAAGVGPRPVPVDRITTARLVAAIKVLQDPQCIAAAEAMRERMRQEDGARGAVDHIQHTMYAAKLDGRLLAYMTEEEEEELPRPLARSGAVLVRSGSLVKEEDDGTLSGYVGVSGLNEAGQKMQRLFGDIGQQMKALFKPRSKTGSSEASINDGASSQ